jgi:hypothetical protein
VKWLTNLLRQLKQDSARGHAPIHREPEPTPAPPRGTQVFIRASDGWQPVVSPEELAATIRQLRTVEAERDEARRSACMFKALYMDPRIGFSPMTDDEANTEARKIAADRVWDCFKEANP